MIGVVLRRSGGLRFRRVCRLLVSRPCDHAPRIRTVLLGLVGSIAIGRLLVFRMFGVGSVGVLGVFRVCSWGVFVFVVFLVVVFDVEDGAGWLF